MHAENQLIRALPAKDRARLLSLCEPVELMLSSTLDEAGTKTKHVYFPTSGFVSLIVVVDDRSALEVGMVGREGMLGVHLALGQAASPLRSLVQGPGHAWRLSAPSFRSALSASPSLLKAIQHYAGAMMMQLATSAACARYHQIDTRLARWLLMSQDRAESDHFQFTQEFLSYMLGVRRAGVTNAAITLQRGHLIEYRRGSVRVLDRLGLEAAACSCYASDRAAYAGSIR